MRLIDADVLTDCINNWYKACRLRNSFQEEPICDVLDSVIMKIQDQETAGKLCNGWDNCDFAQRVVEWLERQAMFKVTRIINNEETFKSLNYEDVPTAFNVDKVLDQLEEMRTKIRAKHMCKSMDGECTRKM